MKNKKLIYIISSIVVLVIVILCIVLLGNKKDNNDKDNSNNNKSNTLLSEVIKKNNKDENYYKKISNAEVLNEDTCFRDYAFISNNSIYIYDYTKLDNGEFSYKKVFDVPSNIKVMNITPDGGADIKFYDYNDILYTLHDNNTDNKVRNSYDMFLNANYNLSDYLKWEYSTTYLGKKIDYDFMSNYAYFKDNQLYVIVYGNERYPNI